MQVFASMRMYDHSPQQCSLQACGAQEVHHAACLHWRHRRLPVWVRGGLICPDPVATCQRTSWLGMWSAGLLLRGRYDTGVISGALPYLRDDILSEYQTDAARSALHCHRSAHSFLHASPGTTACCHGLHQPLLHTPVCRQGCLSRGYDRSWPRCMLEAPPSR